MADNLTELAKEPLNFDEQSDDVKTSPTVKENDNDSSGDDFQDAEDGQQQIEESSSDTGPASNGAKSPAEVIEIQEFEVDENLKVFDKETAIPYTLDTKELGQHVGKESFADSRSEYDENCPPPKPLPQAILLKKLPNTKQEALKGLEIKKDGCLICTDQEALDRQKGVLSEVAKQLAVNLLKGLSISHISLPIKIFEARSSIQRIVDFWSSAPLFLTKAAHTSDPLERLKLVVAFSISNIYLCVGQNKPFNPLLGETNQGTLGDGTRFYCEHTSHHPPISHFLLEGPDNCYRMYGYYEFTGSMGRNSLTSGLRGPNTIEFNDGSNIRFNAPDWRLGGTVMGERTIEGVGSLAYEDIKNRLKAMIVLGTFKAGGFFSGSASGNKSSFEGVVYQMKKPKEQTFFGKGQKLPDKLDKLSDCQKKICKISGNWLEELRFDDQVQWNIEEDRPERQVPLLPSQRATLGALCSSDWRHREDLVWLKYGFMQIAAAWKVKLEVQQRRDRKNRQDCAAALKKKNKK